MDLTTLFLGVFIGFFFSLLLTIIALRYGHRKGTLQKQLLQEILSIDWLQSIAKMEEITRLLSMELVILEIGGHAKMYCDSLFIQISKVRNWVADAIRRHNNIITYGEN